MGRQRILIVDDHEVVRMGLRALLERYPNFEVVAEASSGKEALEKVDIHQPDIVVLDIRLPGMSGVEVCQQITTRHPESHVIMLTSYAEDEMLFAAIRAGAAGYVLKQIGGDDQGDDHLPGRVAQLETANPKCLFLSPKEHEHSYHEKDREMDQRIKERSLDAG